MPPKIALLLYIALVIFMLKQVRKQFPEVSFALWLPTIWMLLIASKPLGVWFQSSGATMEEGSELDRVVLSAMLGVGLFILIKRRFKFPDAIKKNVWLVIMIIYILFSCFWSNSSPFISFKRWSRELIAIVMAFVVASEHNPRKALESLFARVVYILIPLSPILINYFPEYGRMYIHHSGDLMWIGAAMHKNQLAQVCIFAMLFLVWRFFTRKNRGEIAFVSYQTVIEIIMLILAMWTMGGPYMRATYSATAAVAFIVGLLTFIVLLHYKKKGGLPNRIILTGVVVIIISYGTITPFIGKLSILDITSAVGREKNLTGRADVWRELVPVAMERPFMGYGFGGFWSSSVRNQFDISDSHNGYLELILNIGMVGLMLYVIFILAIFNKAYWFLIKDYDWGALWICCLIMGLLVNISEVSFSTLTSRIMAIVLFFAVASEKGLLK